MNELALVQKVWNYAHVLRDQGGTVSAVHLADLVSLVSQNG
jgi:hypothetical protein